MVDAAWELRGLVCELFLLDIFLVAFPASLAHCHHSNSHLVVSHLDNNFCISVPPSSLHPSVWWIEHVQVGIMSLCWKSWISGSSPKLNIAWCLRFLHPGTHLLYLSFFSHICKLQPDGVTCHILCISLWTPIALSLPRSPPQPHPLVKAWSKQ